ncbi:MAG: hypothetical protein EBX51_08010, partial [Acidimicrobiia bacterium]|nr:hypothetical protein [Acidimicrobiia bacterium]
VAHCDISDSNDYPSEVFAYNHIAVIISTGNNVTDQHYIVKHPGSGRPCRSVAKRVAHAEGHRACPVFSS